MLAVEELSLSQGIDPVTHDGTIKLFSLDFVKTGLISKEMLRILKELLSLKKDVDYGDMVTVEEEDAKKALKEAEKFVEELFLLRKSMIEEMEE